MFVHIFQVSPTFCVHLCFVPSDRSRHVFQLLQNQGTDSHTIGGKKGQHQSNRVYSEPPRQVNRATFYTCKLIIMIFVIDHKKTVRDLGYYRIRNIPKNFMFIEGSLEVVKNSAVLLKMQCCSDLSIYLSISLYMFSII